MRRGRLPNLLYRSFIGAAFSPVGVPCHQYRLRQLGEGPCQPGLGPGPGPLRGQGLGDPFVFWNEVEERYWMPPLPAPRLPGRVAGLVALQNSTDLASWSAPEELYETFLTHCPECSEVYRHGDKWVMGYSRFTDRRGTVYRFAKDLRGPWRNFATEGPDGSNWYAAKSVLDANGRRIAFGWVPDRTRRRRPRRATGYGPETSPSLGRSASMARDNSRPRSPKSSLSTLRPHALDEADFRIGKWSVVPGGTGATYEVESTGQFAYRVLRPPGAKEDSSSRLPSGPVTPPSSGWRYKPRNSWTPGSRPFYPRQHRVCAVDVTAARSEVANEYEKATTEYASVAEGVVPRADPNALMLQVVVRGDLVEAFIAGTVTLTYRLATSEPGAVALVVQDGSAGFENVSISSLVGPSGQASDI